jgi:hypothetical protein
MVANLNPGPQPLQRFSPEDCQSGIVREKPRESPRRRGKMSTGPSPRRIWSVPTRDSNARKISAIRLPRLTHTLGCGSKVDIDRKQDMPDGDERIPRGMSGVWTDM